MAIMLFPNPPLGAICPEGQQCPRGTLPARWVDKLQTMADAAARDKLSGLADDLRHLSQM